MIVQFNNLETLSMSMYLPCRFNASALFEGGDKNQFQSLKHVLLDDAFYLEDRAKKMFKSLPSLIDVKYLGELIVKNTETMEL
jgi:hypothetical protein